MNSTPSDNGTYDLVIIGTGPAATRIAKACSARDWKIAVVDRRRFGGTCALRGCNPKKVLVRAAELSDWYGRMRRLFREPASPTLDWKRVVDFKREFTDPVTPANVKMLKDAGIHSIRGTARFTAPTTVSIDGQPLESRRFVVATGAEPLALKMAGAELLTTSDDFLELDELPERIVFVGGGYVSFELAHAAARAGAQCTILERGERPLATFEADLVHELVECTRQVGIEVRTESEVQSISRMNAGELELRVSGPGDDQVLRTGLAVHGAGRVPSLEALHLKAADVDYDTQRGIAVDEYLQSRTNPTIFAAGDAADTGAPKLSPVASYEGRVVAKNLLEPGSTQAAYAATPTVVFTVPPLARVGLTEAQARERGLDFEIESGDQSDWNAVQKVGGPCARYKLLVEKSSEQLLGAHLLGPGADESINLFALLMHTRQPVTRLKETLLAFPTFAAGTRHMV